MSTVTNINSLIAYVNHESRSGDCNGFFGKEYDSQFIHTFDSLNQEEFQQLKKEAKESYFKSEVTDLEGWMKGRNSVSPDLVNEIALKLLEKNKLMSIPLQIRKFLEPTLKINYPALSEKIFAPNVPEVKLMREFFRKAVLDNVSKREEIKVLLNQVLGVVEERSNLEKKVDFLFDHIKHYLNSYYFRISLFVCLNTKQGREPFINLFQKKIAPMMKGLENTYLSRKIVPLCVKFYKTKVSLPLISPSLPSVVAIVSSIASTVTSKTPFISHIFVNLSGIIFIVTQVVVPIFRGGSDCFISSALLISSFNFKTRDEMIFQERCKKAEDLFVARVVNR